MKLGLISDIHAELGALLRAIEVLRAQRVDRILCAGDIVEKGPDGDTVIETLQACLIPCVRGNHDENAVAHAQLENDGSLSQDSLQYLAGLPLFREYLIEGRWVRVMHAPEGGLNRRVTTGELPKAFKRKARTLSGVLVLGHTHQPMCASHERLMIVNPGSVCGGKARDSHTCAVLELPGQGREVGFEVLGLD